MQSDSKHIKNIIKANNDNSLAIFIGAGFSKNSETGSFKLPSWNDLIKDLKKDLFGDSNDESETDFLKIAQLYYLEFGSYTYHKKLKEYFPDYIKPSELHKLVFEINPHIVITTNWDTILEREIEENAHFFDVIASDADLVKSSLQNKLIKMHGDFKNHNIVFKEDDYINYQNKFPLIENYIKSILSTHTVLFLGYSYSDIDLKHIIQWIQSHSSVRPPMYLTMFSDWKNDTRRKYLENHGITTLIIESDNNKNDLSYFERTQNLLTRIKNNDDENIIKSDDDVIDYVYNRLKILNELDGILLEQIQEALANCTFIYDQDSKPILEFYSATFADDNDKSAISVYQKFVEILNLVSNDDIMKPSDSLLKIFNILKKARIKGIVITDEELTKGSKRYIPFSAYIKNGSDEILDSYLDFNFKELGKGTKEVDKLSELAYRYYQIEKFDDAFSTLEYIKSTVLKQRNYSLQFTTLFNLNVLLNYLKNRNFSSGLKNEYKSRKKFDLHDMYFKLPKDLRIALTPIYKITELNFLYEYAYKISKELKSKEESKRTIESGGFVLNSDIYKLSSKHENLINFVLRTKIMIEDFSEYKSINKYFVQISVIRQSQKEETTFNKIELFSCVKYIELKELKDLLSEFYKLDSKKEGKFQLNPELKTWIIYTVFENILSEFIKSNKAFNNFEGYIRNLLFILSIVKLEKAEVDKILSISDMIITEGNNTIGIYEAINLFLGIQYNLYKTEINNSVLIKIIESCINKLLSKKYNFHEYRSIAKNELYNLYGYAKERKIIFENNQLITRLLKDVEDYELSEKLDICQSLLISIYDISNSKIKEKIKSFMLGVDPTNVKELYQKIIFQLTLVIYDFKELDDSIIGDLNIYLSEYKVGKRFSSILYSLENQIDYLINIKKKKRLNSISEVIKGAIERHKQSERLSIF